MSRTHLNANPRPIDDSADIVECRERLDFEPGDLVLLRGRDANRCVTPTQGDTTRPLVVFADNDRPGVARSESALAAFHGRTA